MPLQVVPAGEEDATRAVSIEMAAYGPNPINSILFPGPFPSGNNHRAEDLSRQLREDPGCKWMKVIDTDLADKGDESMIAFSKWYIWDPPRPKGYEPSVHWGPGCNIEACELFFGGMRKKQDERLGGKPFVCRWPTVCPPTPP
jgi:hypothetical protein